MNKKITIIGAGFVGGECARRIVESSIADVILVDIIDGLAEGKALDIMQSKPIVGFTSKIIGTDNYELTKNSDIIIITAGISRKPGMSREDLCITNAKIVASVVKESTILSPNAILIIVTNPLDVMSYLAFKISGFSPKKVIGMAGVLDSSRYRYFISEELSVSANTVEALVLGTHGDSMVPITSSLKVSGIEINKLLSKEKIEKINQRTKDAGAEILNLLKTNSAYYAPSAGVFEMVKCIIKNENKILPCSVYLNGEYDIKDVYVGVPVRLSSLGVEEIIQIELIEEEKNSLKKAVESIKKNIQLIKDLLCAN